MTPKRQPEPTSLILSQADRSGPRVLLNLLLAVLVTALLVLPSGCFPVLRQKSFETIPTIIDIEFSDPGSPEISQTETDQTQSASRRPETGTVKPQAASDAVISELLLAGLLARQKEISLDEAFPALAVGESDIQKTIDHVFALFQSIYFRHPEFFYLDGSINVSYSSVKGAEGYLKSLIIKPQYWPLTADLSDSELDQLIAKIDRIVDKLVFEIQKKAAKPWEQLLLAHDFLVRNVTYDESLNPAKNQVISALLEGETLCQGYAQTFQLIGQRLGADVRMISGEFDGAGHAWNLVKLDGKFYHVDVTHDDPTPDRGPDGAVGHIHFLRSDQVMRETHQWNAANYPACPTDGAHYYRQNQLTVGTHADLQQMLVQYLDGLELSAGDSGRLELLYVGDDLPEESDVGQMFETALAARTSSFSIRYSLQVAKNVISLEITS